MDCEDQLQAEQDLVVVSETVEEVTKKRSAALRAW